MKVQPVYAGEKISEEHRAAITGDPERGAVCPRCGFRKFEHPGFGGFWSFMDDCWLALFVVNCTYFIEDARETVEVI